MVQYQVADLPALVDKRNGGLGYYLFRQKVYKDSTLSKREIYARAKKKGCEQPYCRRKYLIDLTVDHIVPVCVAYWLGWSVRRTKSASNLQLLCQKHHIIKDRNVADLKHAAVHLKYPLMKKSIAWNFNVI